MMDKLGLNFIKDLFGRPIFVWKALDFSVLRISIFSLVTLGCWYIALPSKIRYLSYQQFCYATT
ncbi:hypothetical protein ACVWVP_004576 [Pseudomonas sp. TE24901]